jgi:ubiquinone/menaquinone biosynthesis C-methylase UbiE
MLRGRGEIRRLVAFEELKTRQSAMWGSAPFERIAVTLADMHDELVARLAPRPAERWLDVGTGTGEVALRAARAGADVTGQDLAPVLVETARRLAGAEGLDIRFEVGDAERLSYEDASFDVVSSAVGAIFAPEQAAVARELARVLGPGGRLGLTAWRPDGGAADIFRIMARFEPPPPEAVGYPFDWGREEHVEKLLGDAFDLEFDELDTVYEPESAEAGWEEFSTSFGPAKTLLDSLDDDRRAEFKRAYVEMFEAGKEGGRVRRSRTYLLVLGCRR